MSRRQLEPFSEYESRSVALAESAARDLAEVSRGKVSVALGAESGEYVVTASQYVGSVVTPEIGMLIRPKIPLHNLFSMLDVGLPTEAWNIKPFSYASDPQLLAGFAELFARTVERTLGRGARRDYRREHERVLALRGRIDFPEVLRRPATVSPIACEFDEYTADIDENRYLKAAVRRLLRVPGVRIETRRLLGFLHARLEEVSDVYVDAEMIDRIPSNRLNRHYWPALRLASLVLRNLSLLDRVGSADASAFLLDMNDLFQRWVTDRLRRHLRDRLAVLPEPRWTLDESKRIGLLPDVTFMRDDELVYVGDVKYKLTDTGLGRNGDYYQLLAYTTAQRLPEGVLIYCQPGNAPVEREVVVRHSGQRLWTYQLDMRGSATDLEEAARDMADWISGRSFGHAAQPGVGRHASTIAADTHG